MEGATEGAREFLRRSTSGSKYGMVELVALSFLPGMSR